MKGKLMSKESTSKNLNDLIHLNSYLIFIQKPKKEYVRVNFTFGLTNDPTLTSSVDNARGAIVIRCFSKKGEGPARNQTLITTAVDVLETLNDSTKGTTGTYFKVGSIEGPSFSSNENSPLFMGRIETSYVATVLS